MSAVKADHFARIIDPDNIVIGMRLEYRGDRVPYIDAKILIDKGKTSGMYKLPVFTESPDGERTWIDMPGSTNDTYTVVDIERGRLSKNGVVLPDLVIIKADQWIDSYRAGLRRKDVAAKFVRAVVPLVERDIAEVIGDTVEQQEKIKVWQERMLEEGW